MNLRAEHGHVLRGVLTGYRGSWLTLQNVSALKAGGAVTDLGGEVVLHRETISFLQVVR